MERAKCFRLHPVRGKLSESPFNLLRVWPLRNNRARHRLKRGNISLVRHREQAEKSCTELCAAPRARKPESEVHALLPQRSILPLRLLLVHSVIHMIIHMNA